MCIIWAHYSLYIWISSTYISKLLADYNILQRPWCKRHWCCILLLCMTTGWSERCAPFCHFHHQLCCCFGSVCAQHVVREEIKVSICWGRWCKIRILSYFNVNCSTYRNHVQSWQQVFYLTWLGGGKMGMFLCYQQYPRSAISHKICWPETSLAIPSRDFGRHNIIKPKTCNPKCY